MLGRTVTFRNLVRRVSVLTAFFGGFCATSLVSPTGIFPSPINRAEAQQSVSIPRIEFPGAVFSAVIEGITVSGANLPASEIEAMFRASAISDLAPRLERLNAARITINSVEIRFTSAGQSQSTVYQGFVFTDIRAGVIGRAEIASGKQVMTPASAQNVALRAETTIGKTVMEALDIVTLLRWISMSDPAGAAPFKPLIASYVIDGMTMSIDEMSGRIGKMTSGSIKVRLPRRSVQEIFANLNRQAELKEPATPDIGLMIDMIDLYNSVSFGNVTAEPMTFSGTDKATRQTVSFEIGPTQYVTTPSGRGTVGPIAIKAGGASVGIASLGWQGDYYGAMFAGMAKGLLLDPKTRANSRPADVAWIENYLDKVQLGDLAIRFEGFDLDAPPGRGQLGGQRTRASMSLFDMRASGFIGAVPTAVGLRIDRLKLPLPATSSDLTVKRLRNLGLSEADMSANIDAKWDATRQVLSLGEATYGLDKVGSLRVAGQFGNVPRRFFENPVANWMLLLTGSTAQQVDIAVNDLGGLPKLLALAATEQGKSPQQFQTEVSSMAPAIVAAFASDHPDAPALIDALGKFLRGLGELKITARSSAPEGIGIVELMTFTANPGAVLRKLRIEANGR